MPKISFRNVKKVYSSGSYALDGISCANCDYKRSTSHDYSIDNNDGTDYWKECSICGDKISVEAPKKGCNGSINVSLLGMLFLISLLGIIKLSRKERGRQNE